jgi:uncharacterized Zn-binding protein involved in type VI secretion
VVRVDHGRIAHHIAAAVGHDHTGVVRHSVAVDLGYRDLHGAVVAVHGRSDHHSVVAVGHEKSSCHEEEAVDHNCPAAVHGQMVACCGRLHVTHQST